MKQPLDESKIKQLIRIDIPQALDGATNYTSHVIRLIQKADPTNRRRLADPFPNEVEAFVRWSRICNAEAFMPEVGEVVVAGRAFLDVEPGMLGVVYERYDRTRFDADPEDNVGVSIIFETGSYDGFSRHDMDMCQIEFTGKLDELARYYEFENVGQLDQDFQRGVFDLALGKRERPEPGEPRQNISLTDEDFAVLVKGGELVKEHTTPKTHIILQDIGFDRMFGVVDEAMNKKL